MEVFGLKGWVGVFLLLACLAGLTSCGGLVATSGGPPRPAGSADQDAALSQFRDAERAYQQKDYARARGLFEALVRQYPQSLLRADASFRLGEIFYYEGRYESAQQALEQFLITFPGSKLAPDAAYLRGLSLLESQRFPQSRAAFEQLEGISAEPRAKGRARLGLAKVTAAEGQSLRAIEDLRAIVHTPQLPDEVREQARDLAVELVTHRLTPSELEEVKRRWPLEFPTDAVLLRQAQDAWNRQDAALAQSLSEEFVTKFPQHAQAQAMQAFISTIIQARSGRVDQDKIGIILPLSGPAGRQWVSEVGESALHGIQVAFAREGFSPLKLEVRDCKADVALAASLTEELINTQHVIALVGPILNETAEVAAKKAAYYGVPLLTPGAPFGELPRNSPYVFRTGLTDRLEARRLAEYAVGPLGLRRFAILHPNDRAGREAAEIFQARVGELGGEIVVREGYEPTRVDFTPQMRRLGGKTDAEVARMGSVPGGPLSGSGTAEAAPGPGRLPYEALYLPRSFERLELLVAALRVFNIAGITLLGESGWNHPELTRRGGTFLEGAIFMDGFFVRSSEAPVREFVHAYRAMFNVDPDLMAAQSYDAMLMLLRVLKQRPKTRDDVKEGLRNIREFRGVTGRMSALSTGEMDKPLFALTVRGGQIVQLN